MVNLSQRLKTMASFVTKGAVLADIGSDHGLLLEYCLEQNIITKGYATDNKIGPYRRLLSRFAHQDHVTTYLADGLDKLPSDVDTLVIAGMGGSLIIRIINDNASKLATLKRIILAPHQQVSEVRTTMMHLGYYIVKEDIVAEDGHFYDIIAFEKGIVTYSSQQLTYGPLNLSNRHQILLAKMHQRIDEINRILAKDIPTNKRDTLSQELEWLKHYDQN